MSLTTLSRKSKATDSEEESAGRVDMQKGGVTKVHSRDEVRRMQMIRCGDPQREKPKK